MTPDVLAILAGAAVVMAGVVAAVWAATGDRRIEPRRAARPPVGGARVAGPGALYDLPRHEPEIVDPASLIRPYVTHPLGIGRTAPPQVPSASPQAGRAVVLQLHRCAICRDGRALGVDRECPWCHCPRGGWSA